MACAAQVHVRSTRRGMRTWVVVFLLFVALPALAKNVDPDEDEDEAEERRENEAEEEEMKLERMANAMSMEEMTELMTWDEPANDKRREWIDGYRQGLAMAISNRLQLGRGGVFGGYEYVLKIDDGIPKGKTEPNPSVWRHRCLDVNLTYDKLDDCAFRTLTALAAVCQVQADKSMATPALKKVIKDHMRVLNSGMVYELGILRRKISQGIVWGLSPSMVSELMQKEHAKKSEIPMEKAMEFSMHLTVQAAMMNVYFACAGPMGVESYWETAEDLWRGLIVYYNEKSWDKVGVPQEQAYNFVRVLGQTLSNAKDQSAVYPEIEQYAEGYELFIYKYWQQFLVTKETSQYNGCEALAFGIANRFMVGAMKKQEKDRSAKWFEDMLVKNFQSIRPPKEETKNIKPDDKITMINACGLLLFQASWVKISKDPGMTIQHFRDMNTSISGLELTEDRYEPMRDFMEKTPNSSALIGGLITLPQLMQFYGRYSYRFDDIYDCLDALHVTSRIMDDLPTGMPLRPQLPKGFPMQPGPGGMQQPPGQGVPQMGAMPQMGGMPQQKMSLDAFNIDKGDDDEEGEL